MATHFHIARGFLFASLLFFIPLLAQSQSISISGKVLTESNAAVSNAKIQLQSVSGKGQYNTNTDSAGSFLLEIPKGVYSLHIEKQSALQLHQKLALYSDTVLTFITGSSILKLDEVQVTATQKTNAGVEMLSMKQVQQIPNLLGEADALRALQFLPGIQAGGEGTSGYFVRGGSLDQNLFLWDGAPLYNVSHLAGLLSVYNPDAVDNLVVYKGGFPAEYGGRLSSIVDVNAKEGSHDSSIFKGSIGLIASKLTYEHPYAKGKGSILLSGRRTYADVFTRLINKNKNNPAQYIPTYYFYDLNLKADYNISDKQKLWLTAYNGSDHLDIHIDELNYKTNWGNTSLSLNWEYQMSQTSILRTTIDHSRYRYSIANFDSSYSFGLQSDISDIGGNAGWTKYLGNNLQFKSGIQLVRHTFTPQAVTADADAVGLHYSSAQRFITLESAVYSQTDWTISKKWKLQAGIRGSLYLIGKYSRIAPEPRLNLNYKIKNNTGLSFSYTRMNQFMHLVSNNNASLPIDVWYPATGKLVPQSSDQWSAGFHTHFMKNRLAFEIEPFYKRYDHVVEYAEGADIMREQDFSQEMVSGKGWSYGNELSLRKTAGKLTGSLAYTLSWSKRQFAEKNFGKAYYTGFDRRHYISLNANYEFSKRASISTGWIFATGNPVWLPEGRMWFGNIIPYLSSYWAIYNEKNTFRLPPFHHLDISVTWNLKPKKGEAYFSFGVYNIYNRRNTYFIHFKTLRRPDYSVIGFDAERVSLLPLIPFVSFNFKK